ncbi:MAG: hypothetical protein ACOCV8_03795, partial [Spirochaetota bacterium]
MSDKSVYKDLFGKLVTEIPEQIKIKFIENILKIEYHKNRTMVNDMQVLIIEYIGNTLSSVYNNKTA